MEYPSQFLFKVRGRKNAEGKDEFVGAVTSIMGKTPAESGRVVRLYSSGRDSKDLGVCLVIDCRLRVIRHAYIIQSIDVNGRNLA